MEDIKAIKVEGAPGGERNKLIDILPLRTPFLVEFFVKYSCNFKCVYCIHSIDKDKRGYISNKVTMSLETYKKCIDDISKFPDKLKVIRFAGMGEPLLHKDIVEMVRYANDKQVTDKIEILTNASLLSHKMSDGLIKAGLGRLYISLQGMSSQRYSEVCGYKLDFNKLVENIKYYYEHKGNLKVHIKIMDYALQSENDKELFYSTFGNICDSIGIEYASPIYPYVDYDKILDDKSDTVTQFGLKVDDIKVCPQPFFRLHIITDSACVACYGMKYPEIVGDVNKESIIDIWNGDKLKKFRNDMLNKGLCSNEVCKDCEIIRHRLFKEDILDNDIERLKRIY